MSADPSIDSVSRKLPVFSTVAETYGFVFSNLGLLFRVAWFPAVLYGVLQYLAIESMVENFEALSSGDLSASFNISFLGLTIVSYLVLVPLMTAWHRAALQPEALPAGPLVFRFGKAEVIFTLYAILIYVLVLIIGMLLAGILSIGAAATGSTAVVISAVVIAFVAMLLLTMRYAMIFPAVAIGASANLSDSWRATKGSAFRMLAITILVAIPIVLISTVIMELMPTPEVTTTEQGRLDFANLMSQTPGLSPISLLINIPLMIIYTAVSVSGLSVMFRFLADRDLATNVDEVFD